MQDHRSVEKLKQNHCDAVEPLVSVITPTHNRPQTLPVALNSIVNQTFKNVEVIVINDGGCDVQSIIDDYNRKLNITYINYSQNKGPSAARNIGLRKVRGKYIAYLDDDDIWYPEHLKTLVDFLEKNPYHVAYTDAYIIVQKKQDDTYVTISKEIFYGQDFNRDYLLVASYIIPLSIMYSKICLEKVGYFDESLRTHEDLDMWIRLAHHYDFARIPTVTGVYTEKDDGISATSLNKLQRLKNLELLYNRYREWASPRIRYLQKKVLQRMYTKYGLELPDHLK